MEDVATPEGFARDPVLVHGFYNLRRSWHKQARPNAAHVALARLEREHGNVLTVTQNIDALHEAAGTTNLIHMHGELERAPCAACGVIAPWKEDLSIKTLCQACGEAAMRPRCGVVRRDAARDGAHHARRLRAVHLHRHQRHRLSSGRLRDGSLRFRRPCRRAQSRAFRRRRSVPGADRRLCHRDRPCLRRLPSCDENTSGHCRACPGNPCAPNEMFVDARHKAGHDVFKW
jgi:hypothetical protein